MLNTTNRQNEQPKLIPLSKWNDFYEFPKVSTLRQLSFKNTNDFNNVVVRRIATRMYIDVEAFFKWVDMKQTAEV